MVVNEERMLHNLELGKGLVFSGQLLLELTARGMRREDAYRVVQAHAMEAWKRGDDFRARAREDPEIRKTMKEAEVDEIFRLERYLDHVDTIFARVFGDEALGASSETKRS
jgi:adenylosuccinate lyase